NVYQKKPRRTSFRGGTTRNLLFPELTTARADFSTPLALRSDMTIPGRLNCYEKSYEVYEVHEGSRVLRVLRVMRGRRSADTNH
ncbi:MAG: hypothetical protein Q7T82_12605, partial [Armatimonadota bacterium]|nr:hypothetical protein [Armatimonadota bacterium]